MPLYYMLELSCVLLSVSFCNKFDAIEQLTKLQRLEQFSVRYRDHTSTPRKM